MDYRYDGRNPYGSAGGYVRDRYSDDMDMRGGEDYRGDMRGNYPDMRGNYGRDYNYDMRGYDGHKKLSPDKLHRWVKMLMMEVDDKYKQYLSKEQVINKAEQMGIEFEKFTPDEFHATVVMLFTDFQTALGTTSLEVYIKMAKAFLCDADASVKYGKKLARYYEAVVEE